MDFHKVQDQSNSKICGRNDWEQNYEPKGGNIKLWVQGMRRWSGG